MTILPTHCDRCSTSALVAAATINEGVAICVSCGGSATVLPGEAFNEEDASLFAYVVATLREAGITPSQAALLTTELESRSVLAPGRCLRRLAQVLPPLGVLELLVGSDPAMLRKAESMLAMLLDVLARERRHSELVPAGGPKSKVGGD